MNTGRDMAEFVMEAARHKIQKDQAEILRLLQYWEGDACCAYYDTQRNLIGLGPPVGVGKMPVIELRAWSAEPRNS